MMVENSINTQSRIAMKKIAGIVLMAALISSAFTPVNAEEKNADSLVIYLQNRLNVSRVDEAISIDVAAILKRFPGFKVTGSAVYDAGIELASQVDDTNRDGEPDLLTFVANFAPNEKKKILLRNFPPGARLHEMKKRTQAELSVKVGYEYIDGKFTKGKFVNIDSIRIPANHVDHDALFRYEGPGWESDKAAYRFYFDARNRTDIFGKKVPEMVLQTVGVNDLVADNNESYQSMMSWGMDVFKVGTSLGIGSIGMPVGKEVVTVSKTDSVFCVIAANGPVRSDVRANYYGWTAGEKKYDLVSDYSITGGSRLTKHSLHISPNPDNLCTGLAKHEGATLIEPKERKAGQWQYLGLYGKQSRFGDEMGIAVFFNGSDLLERREDAVSHLVVLRPGGGKLTYYFAAAWVQEPGGIKTIDEFREYLDRTVQCLDSPIGVGF